MKLTGPQREQLTEALTDAYPDKESLEQMISFGLNETLDVFIGATTLKGIIFKLISWAESQERLGELLKAARKRNPGNEKLRKVVEQLLVPPVEVSQVDKQEEAFGLEEIVRPYEPFVNIAQLLKDLQSFSVAVCRIEMPAGSARGTGFLLGSDLVITNYHVIEPVLDDSIQRDQVFFRFDYKTDAEGKNLNTGITYTLALGKPWLIAHSPIKALDYALLRLNIPSAEQRKWLRPQRHTCIQGQILHILQHPQGDPQQIATGSVSKVNDIERRIYYTINTCNGSSGSPCFNNKGELVALHASWDRSSSENRGVPFTAILAHLEQNNLLSLLGAFDSSPPITGNQVQDTTSVSSSVDEISEAEGIRLDKEEPLSESEASSNAGFSVEPVRSAQEAINSAQNYIISALQAFQSVYDLFYVEEDIYSDQCEIASSHIDDLNKFIQRALDELDQIHANTLHYRLIAEQDHFNEETGKLRRLIHEFSQQTSLSHLLQHIQSELGSFEQSLQEVKNLVNSFGNLTDQSISPDTKE